MNDPEVRKAVEALVDFVSDHGTVGHYLPEILQDVDPEGLLIPAEVTRRLAHVTSKEDVWPLARVAGIYAIGSSAWRTIAKPVIVRAVRSGSEEERRSLFNSLTDHRPRYVVGNAGRGCTDLHLGSPVREADAGVRDRHRVSAVLGVVPRGC